MENSAEAGPCRWFDSTFFGSIEHTIDPSLLCDNSSATQLEAPIDSPRLHCFQSIFLDQSKKLEESVAELLAEYRCMPPNDAGTWNLKAAESRVAKEIFEASIAAACLKIPSQMSAIDDSDVTDDEDPTYGFIDSGMHELSRNSIRQVLVLPNLKLSHRRHAHALARCMGLNHFSIGNEGDRILIVSKDRSMQRPTKSLKNAFRSVRQPDKMSEEPGQRSAASQGTRPPSFERQMSPRQSRTRVTRCSSGQSTDTGASSASTGGNVKRRRQSRHEGAFICYHEGCEEVFDRQCDLSQHERNHLVYEQRPYGCEICNKRFLFPKDLRRHEKTHRLPEGNSFV